MEVVDNERLNGFLSLFLITKLISVILVVLVIYWSFAFRGGFAWTSNIALKFNWHPLLMVIGMIYLQGGSILIYRGFRNAHKRSLKIAHAGLHAGAIICVLFAAIAVFDNHNLSVPPKPNLYSLHSWIGALATTLYLLQWIGSLIIYLLPGIPPRVKAAIMPYHIFFGLVIFTISCAAAVVGLNESAIFNLRNKYGDLGSEAVLMNIMGIIIVIFSVLVIYLTTNENFRRLPRPEDRELLSRQSD